MQLAQLAGQDHWRLIDVASLLDRAYSAKHGEFLLPLTALRCLAEPNVGWMACTAVNSSGVLQVTLDLRQSWPSVAFENADPDQHFCHLVEDQDSLLPFPMSAAAADCRQERHISYVQQRTQGPAVQSGLDRSAWVGTPEARLLQSLICNRHHPIGCIHATAERSSESASRVN